ncbi:hypothetical protein DFAR_2980010 [Desulfarculales bacterium]
MAFWRLNERHYGRPCKAETTARHRAEQVQVWRHSFDQPLPPLAPDDSRHLRQAPSYTELDPALLPVTESLKDTLTQVMPYWHQEIAPNLRLGRRMIVSAHGNSLRALYTHLLNIGDQEISGLELPTGDPWSVTWATTSGCAYTATWTIPAPSPCPKCNPRLEKDHHHDSSHNILDYASGPGPGPGRCPADRSVPAPGRSLGQQKLGAQILPCHPQQRLGNPALIIRPGLPNSGGGHPRFRTADNLGSLSLTISDLIVEGALDGGSGHRYRRAPKRIHGHHGHRKGRPPQCSDNIRGQGRSHRQDHRIAGHVRHHAVNRLH